MNSVHKYQVCRHVAWLFIFATCSLVFCDCLSRAYPNIFSLIDGIVVSILPFSDFSSLVRVDSVVGFAKYLSVSLLCVLATYILFVAFLLGIRKFLFLRRLVIFTQVVFTQSQGVSWQHILSRILLAISFGVFAYGEIVSSGRPILSFGLSLPGSLIARYPLFSVLSWNAPFWVGRIFEPSVWFLIILLFYISTYSAINKKSVNLYALSASLLICYLSIQSLFLIPQVASALSGHDVFGCQFETLLGYFVYLLSQCALIAVLFAAINEVVASDAVDNDVVDDSAVSLAPRLLTVGRAFKLGFVCVLSTVFFIGGFFSSYNKPSILVGSYYYSWFPNNWSHGYVGRKLKLQITPELGEYSSNDLAVFRKHLNMAKDAGINFFIMDWWPNRPWVRDNYKNLLSEFDSDGKFKFAIHYETLDIDDPSKPSVLPNGIRAQEGENIRFMTPQRADRMKLHWQHIADFYMKHPSYLRVNGRPVLFVYATRHLVGDVANAIREARMHVEKTTGVKLFLVADEVFFNVMNYSSEDGIYLMDYLEPNWDRLVVFDALTAYNPYDSTKVGHGGYEGVSSFVGDVTSSYATYKEIANTLGVLFVPSVIPGYNDRGVRLVNNHFVIPRTIDWGSQDSFLKKSFYSYCAPFIDQYTPMFTVTSWNEWNEGTQIEPSIESECVDSDISSSSTDYTKGALQCGYGRQYLNELSQLIKSINIR